MSKITEEVTTNEEKKEIDSSKYSQGITDILLKYNAITKDQLRTAQKEAINRKDGSVISALITMGFITESVLYDLLSSDQSKHDTQSIHSIVFSIDVLKKIPKEFALGFKVIPISEDETSVRIATSDPYNIILLDKISSFFNGKEVIAVPYPDAEVTEIVMKHYSSKHSMDLLGILEEIGNEENTNKSKNDLLSTKGANSPVVRFIDALFYDAIRIGASDIHVEPDELFVRIRVRIDGVLINKTIVHKNYWSGICVRLKILSGMNIAESRKPQDGGISMTIQGRPVDFRVSSIPTIHGENIVIRVLDRTKSIITLEELGFSSYALKMIKLSLNKPEGIIIVTGPTGSGKTTTLYSTLAMINSISDNIMTLEEPVEYRLPLIRQSEINHKAGFDFSSGLRSLLRQDPDIIFLGEIRDMETAQTALRASATGHQVFSTLHTNNAISAVTRLIDIGIQSYMLSGSLVAVIAQRLVRKLCPTCRQSVTMKDDMKKAFNLDQSKEYTIYKAQGCNACYETGYKGRIVIAEVLFMTEEMNLIIAGNPTIAEIAIAAKKSGFRNMSDDAIEKVLSGVTSWEEVKNTIDMTNYLRHFDL